MDEPQKQHKKQYDWLKGYQFQPGQSGNPGGKKKGTKSLKTFAREYLENLPDEEKVNFLASLPEELVFRMAEGNPKQDTEHSGRIEVSGIEINVRK
jgi:hypothetical protein